MNIINNTIDNLKGVSGINNKYIILVIITILVVLGIKLINKLVNRVYSMKKRTSKNVFKFRERTNILFNLISLFAIFLLWENHLSNVVTIISFISAGATIALREVILNLFAGFFIRISKPFVVEDRIEIDDIKGDVVLINAMSFKVLELSDRLNGEQSSGIIVNVPNSMVFSKTLKNYTTAFKYIWSEMIVKIPFTADIDLSKKALYKIVNQNEIIKSIPKKMDKAIDEASGSYRIYYNNLKPIIYTEYVEDHIELTIRFLVHPKKERSVLNNLWIKIIKEAQNGNICLYTKD